jgi:PEP-CTERM motif
MSKGFGWAGLVVLSVALLLSGGAAYADTIGTLNLGASNWTANGTLTTSGGTNGTWSLTFNFVNGTGNTVDVNSFAVQLFNAGSTESFTVTNAALNGGSLGFWEYFADDKLNNGSTPDCSSTSVKGWLCADTGQPTLHPYSIDSGQSASFVFTGTYASTGAVNPLDLMASGCLVAGTCMLDGGSSNENKWAVSAPMTAPTTVPEPPSLMLLGSGLSVLGMVLWRKRSESSEGYGLI